MGRLVVLVVAAACARGAPEGAPAGVRDVAPGAKYPGAAAPVVLDAEAKTLLAVSSDGQRAVVSSDPLRACSGNPRSGPPCDLSSDVPLRLVTAGSGSLALGVGGRTAFIPDDGRFVLTFGASGSFIARIDGTGLRPSTGYSPAFGWLYSSTRGDLFRQRDFDDEPSLVVAAADAANYELSPDGESILYCTAARSCRLQAPIGAPPVPVPFGAFWLFSRDWLFVWPCTFVDLAGAVTSVCDPASLAPGTLAHRVGDTAVFLTSDGNAHVHDFASAAEAVFPAPPSADAVTLSPDGRKVLAFVVENVFDPAAPFTLFEAPASGGAWTMLGANVERWSISENSRFVGMARFQGPTLLSVDGAPGRPAGGPGFFLGGGVEPRFEPAGGFDKATFTQIESTPDAFQSVVGNADGTGDWLRLPSGAGCLEWAGHTALCWNGDHLYGVHGEVAGILARGVRDYKVARAGRKILFIGPDGLATLDLP